MSENSSKKACPKPAEIIAIQELILEYILSNQWKDYEGFARRLSERILREKPNTERDLLTCVEKFSHPFYSFNSVNKARFFQTFPQKHIIERLNNLPEEKSHVETRIVVSPQTNPVKNPITCAQIFPELANCSLEDGLKLVTKLNLPERILQNEIRNALREKGATNMVERKSDTSLEVADLEDFSLKIGEKWHSFVSVVKGYDSLRKSRVRWVDVIHQITKGYQGTKPDYVLLVLGKEPVDGLITQLVTYGDCVGNRNLGVYLALAYALMNSCQMANFNVAQIDTFQWILK